MTESGLAKSAAESHDLQPGLSDVRGILLLSIYALLELCHKVLRIARSTLDFCTSQEGYFIDFPLLERKRWYMVHVGPSIVLA